MNSSLNEDAFGTERVTNLIHAVCMYHFISDLKIIISDDRLYFYDGSFIQYLVSKNVTNPLPKFPKKS